jgi:hypothetical protein
MTETEFAVASNESAGLCLACGAISYGGVEPGCRHCFCDECENHQVMSLENALEAGHIEVVQDQSEVPEGPLEAGTEYPAPEDYV